MEHVNLYGFWQSERGFTLVEVMFTIIIMAIVLATASSMWFGAVESRRVDSATNQVVAELRQAHTRATNRLVPWRVQWADPAGSTTYQIGPDDGPDADTLPDDDALYPPIPLPEGTQLSGGISPIVFSPNGEAQLAGVGNITVADDDGCPFNEIQVNPVTSKITVLLPDPDEAC